MAAGSPMLRVLAVEADQRSAGALERALVELGADAVVAPHVDAAWREFGRQRSDLILCAASTPRGGADLLLDRMRAQDGERMPAFHVMGTAEDATPGMIEAGPDGFLLRPVSRTAVASILTSLQPAFDVAESYASLLRRLFGLTLLDAGEEGSAERIAADIAECFSVTDCVLWTEAGGEPVVHLARDRAVEKIPPLLDRCRLAARVGATTYTSANEEAGDASSSLLGIRLTSREGADLGAVCLVDATAHTFTELDRDALQLIAERLATEVLWVAAHDRILVEHEQLRASALEDALTGVWSRPAFEQLTTTEIAAADRRQETLSLAIFDVDQLRAINDRHGHLAGDAALAHIARTLQANLRASDLVGRFGEDEIAVLLSGADVECAHSVVEKLVDRVANAPVWHHGARIEIKVTAGLTQVRSGEKTGEEAFGRAVAALSEAGDRSLRVAVRAPTLPAPTPDLPEDAPATGTALALPAGSTLGGSYRIIHEVSRGAMGVVYRAEDMGLARPVAIKVLRSDLARDQELVKRFRQEAAILASLHHPHLVQVFSFGATGGEVYFVMELVEGQSLADVILRMARLNERIDIEVIIKVVEEIADALEAMHAVGLIHRDVKPANVLLDQIRERAVLVDVGVAKRRGVTGQPAGTPGFAAPESFTEAEEGPGTDVYGLAATIHMALTGDAPFGGGSVVEVIDRQMTSDLPAPSSRRADLSPAVDSVLRKALSPQQGDRFGSAGAFAVALSSALSRLSRVTTPERSLGAPAPPPTTAGQPVARAPKPPVESEHLAKHQRPRVAATERMANEPKTRGAVFRVAHTMLSRSLGSAWIRKLAQSDESLAEILKPNLPPAGWHRLDLLTGLLERAAETHGRPHDLARALGRSLMTVSFPRFFGADPSLHKPMTVLKAAEFYWPRYHTWGRVKVAAGEGDSCTVTIDDTPAETLVCAFVGGSLERIAELADARSVRVAHLECVCQGQERCVYALQWQPAPHPATADTEQPPKS